MIRYNSLEKRVEGGGCLCRRLFDKIMYKSYISNFLRGKEILHFGVPRTGDIVRDIFAKWHYRIRSLVGRGSLCPLIRFQDSRSLPGLRTLQRSVRVHTHPLLQRNLRVDLSSSFCSFFVQCLKSRPPGVFQRCAKCRENSPRKRLCRCARANIPTNLRDILNKHVTVCPRPL